MSYCSPSPNSAAGGRKKNKKERCRKERAEQWRTESVLVLWSFTMLPLLCLYAVQIGRKSEMERPRLMLRIRTGLEPGAAVRSNLAEVLRANRETEP